MEHPLKLVKARTRLLLKFPFFGQLALKCDFKKGGQTMATDGRYFYYNEDFLDRITQEEVMAVLVHEILHNAFLHSYRLNARDKGKWNIACDYAINAIIIEEYAKDLTLPEDRLYDPSYSNMSAEKIYSSLPEQSEEPSGWGGVIEASDDQGASVAEQENDWKIAVTQASNMADKQGAIPAQLKRLIEEAKAKVSWQDVLRSFTLSNTHGDYAWYPPNQLYMQYGLHVPSTQDYAMGPIAIAVDTSGSITMATLSRFFAEISSIIETCKPERVYLIYCDSKINGEVLELDQYDLPLKPEIRGGGATAFKPVFDYIEKKALDIEWLVYITDLYGTFPEEPNYPVLWARTSNVDAPFGTHINLD